MAGSVIRFVSFAVATSRVTVVVPPENYPQRPNNPEMMDGTFLTFLHLVVWPREDGELSRFAGWLTLTHTQRWHAYRQSAGSGHLFQGRFKSFPIQEDEH